MENAVDALKIAFAVFIFIVALSLAMFMFTQARETADIVLESSDVTEFMDFVEVADTVGEDRIVGLETIIPTLYKYFKENYTVIFLNSNGTPLDLYITRTNPRLWSVGYTNRYYSDNVDTKICSFDVDEETRRREPWTGNTNYYKQNLDMFLSGGTFVAPSGNGMDYNYSDRNVNGWGTSNSFIEQYKDKQFRESLGEYTYNSVNSGAGQTNEIEDDEFSSGVGDTQDREKRVIIYTLLN